MYTLKVLVCAILSMWIHNALAYVPFHAGHDQRLHQSTLNHVSSAGLDKAYEAGRGDFDERQLSYVSSSDSPKARKKSIINSYSKSHKVNRRSSGNSRISSLSSHDSSHDSPIVSSVDSGWGGSDSWSVGSSPTSRHVGFTRVKHSCLKDVKLLAGVEALGIFIWGDGFVIGAHTDNKGVEESLNVAIAKAHSCGTITTINIIKEEGNLGDVGAHQAISILKRGFPHVQLKVHTYPRTAVGTFEFQASVRRPGEVSWVHQPNGPPGPDDP